MGDISDSSGESKPDRHCSQQQNECHRESISSVRHRDGKGWKRQHPDEKL